MPFYKLMWKNIYNWAGHRWQHAACALRVG